jgi:UDP-N-acetylglucosamine 2-epimerase (non-hydrolysing)
MKVTPLYKELLKRKNITPLIAFTGQHYDGRMSQIFFDELGLKAPHFKLDLLGLYGSPQFAQIMVGFAELIQKEQPDLVVVVGDVNSSAACALAAYQNKIKVAHVEAGLRSFDLKMPEEVNRRLIDSVSDLLFVTEKSGLEHLDNEAIEHEKTYFTGNLMIDSLVQSLAKSDALPIQDDAKNPYYLLTFHRPSNVDTKERLKILLDLCRTCASLKQVLFPLHPRTENNLIREGLLEELKAIKNLKILPPQGYLEFLKLMKNTEAVITDSGGIQEETTFLKVPCLTLRNSTERPSTVEIGSNTLITNFDITEVKKYLQQIEKKTYKTGEIPPLWDGTSAVRTADVLCEVL